MQEEREYLFICCCEEDKRWLTKFQKAMFPLTRKEQFKIWDYTCIPSTARWYQEIEDATVRSKAALLLVSIDFLASPFIVDIELPLLQDAQRDGLRIAWVAVSPSLYQYTDLAHYQALNDPTRPLDSLTPARLKQEMISICKEVKKIMDMPMEYTSQSTGRNIRIVGTQKQDSKESTNEESMAS